ncbi:hypothetical protein SSTU70S_06272 [Stutzerimonas stutzeri]
MRSLFWRILATFWLAIALVAGLALLLGRLGLGGLDRHAVAADLDHQPLGPGIAARRALGAEAGHAEIGAAGRRR